MGPLRTRPRRRLLAAILRGSGMMTIGRGIVGVAGEVVSLRMFMIPGAPANGVQGRVLAGSELFIYEFRACRVQQPFAIYCISVGTVIAWRRAGEASRLFRV